jgi:hypothetical protein
MRVEKRLSIEDSNEFIKGLINSNNPFLISRIGLGGETAVSVFTLMGVPINPTVLNWFYTNAGFYGTDDFKRYASLYKEGFINSDGVAYWNFPGFQEMEDYLIPNEKELIDVGALESFRLSDPWTKLLVGKKILIVHPFKSTIEDQLKNRDNIWSDPFVLPDSEYTVYQSIQSIGGVGPHKDWYESFEIMCQDISKIDFDIALLGCGSYGVPLSSYIKNNLKKSAIYVGGGLQLYFGIKGKRWDNSQDVVKFYNSNWVRPSDDEKPEKKDAVEGGCYW